MKESFVVRLGKGERAAYKRFGYSQDYVNSLDGRLVTIRRTSPAGTAFFGCHAVCVSDAVTGQPIAAYVPAHCLYAE